MVVKLPEQILENVERDVKLYESYLKKVADTLLSQGVTKYPIFVLHRENSIDLGRPILLSEKQNSDWSVNASLLEEFVNKKIVRMPLVPDFKKIYKDPRKFMCLFVISGTDEAGFAFCPYTD